jgi:hypothetical protein
VISIEGVKIDIDNDDIDLIESFNQDNRNAFNYLVLKYQKKIYCIIRKAVFDKEEKEKLEAMESNLDASDMKSKTVRLF